MNSICNITRLHGKRYQQIYELLLNFIVMQKYILHVKDLLCIKAQQAEYFKY